MRDKLSIRYRVLVEVFCLHRIFIFYSTGLILAVVILSLGNLFQRTDWALLDTAFQLNGRGQPDEDIVIVAITSEDFLRGAPRWPWPRSLMARLIDEIVEQQPAVLAIDILFTEATSSEMVFYREQFEPIRPYLYHVLSGNPLERQTEQGIIQIGAGDEQFDKIVEKVEAARHQDTELAMAIKRGMSLDVSMILASQSAGGTNLSGVMKLYPELERVAQGSIGLVDVSPDVDGVLRNYIPYGIDNNGAPVISLALSAVSSFNESGIPSGNVVPSDQLENQSNFQDRQFLVNFKGPPGTYPVIPAIDVLRGGVDISAKLQGKLVFLGVTDPSVGDFHGSVYSGSKLMPGVEFHAAAADTNKNNAYISITSQPVRILFVILVGFSGLFLGRYPRPVIGLIGVSAIGISILSIYLLLFMRFSHFAPVSACLVVLGLGYMIALSDRARLELFEKKQARLLFSKYLSPDVVHEILKKPAEFELETRRTDVSILFSDIRGFTTLSETMVAEDLVQLLNEYLAMMTRIIFSNGGTVDKFQGDGILAFFGAPLTQDDHTERAVLTALEMNRGLDDIRGEWLKKTGSVLNIGVAVHTGEVMVGNIGSSLRTDYTVIGDAVNVTARIQDLTKEYGVSILLSDAVQEIVKLDFCTRSLGVADIRGRQGSVEVFELIDRQISET